MRRLLALLLVATAAVAAYAGITQAGGKKRLATASERVALTVTVSGSELARPATLRVDGAVDNDRRLARFTIDATDLAAALPVHLPVTKVETVVDTSRGGLVAYAKVPLLAQIVAGGKPWAKVDLGSLARTRGVDLSSLTALAASPGQLLPQLRALSSETTVIGPETVDGSAATHSRLTIDVQRLATLAPAAQRDLAAQALAELVRESGVATVPIDVWADASGLLRRVTLTHASPDGDGSVSIDLRARDYGAAVDVQVPAAAQVTDLTSLIGRN
jgi:hypothetical protein